MGTNTEGETMFFDAYVTYGPWKQKHPAQSWRLESVLDDMQHCSIAGALVTHRMCVNFDPMHSNLRLCDDIKGHDNLYPLWNVLPHQTGQVPEPTKLLELMELHGVRAITLSPKTNGWDMLSEGSVPLLNALEKSRVLTIIRRNEMQSFAELESLLKRYPNLPVLLSHTSWAEPRFVVPLMQLYPNLHLTFNHYQVHYGPEWLVEMGLEDRLLYSSNATEMSMGAHRTYISYANISAEAKAKIAGGNLKRLLKGDGPSKAVVNPDEDDMMRLARLGLPQEEKVIDPHIHILYEGMNGGGRFPMHRGGPKGVLALLERLGYDGGCYLSWDVISGDSISGNEAVRQALDVSGDGYWGASSFDPAHYSQDQLEVMINELGKDKRFKQLKPFFFEMRYDDPRYDIWWQYADDHRHIILLDRNRSHNDFSEVYNVAERFPNASWLIPHIGGSFALADAGIECVKQRENVYLDLTYTTVPAGIVEYMVEHAGEDRILYGSDLPMRDPRQQLGWVIYSRLSQQAKKKVLGLNALELLKRCKP